jgi:hypothetical protein
MRHISLSTKITSPPGIDSAAAFSSYVWNVVERVMEGRTGRKR